jgi:DNA-directed RNA polymerase specialized sigma24 family protein
MSTPTDASTLEAFCKLAVGSDAKKRLAQKEVFYRFAPAVAGYLAQKFIPLDPTTLEGCISTAFLQFFQRAERDDFDPDQACSLLFTIADRRAADVLRTQKRGRMSFIDYLDDIQAALENTEMGQAWNQAADRGETSEIIQLFKELVATLPREQQEVARAMVRGFPGQLTDQEICQSILDASGKSKTIAGVKRCRQEIRQKFDALLKRHNNRPFSTPGAP